MNPTEIIDSYVVDVTRHLPRRLRGDVALELRSLLAEELASRATDAERAADAPMTMELLTDFGAPADVADRYLPRGFTIIRPSSAPRFAWIALGGILVQWAISLPAIMLGIAPVVGWDYGAGTWWGRLTVWWLGPGLGALWWPGLLITFTLIAALVARRRENATTWAPIPPRVIDRELVHRPTLVLWLVLGVLGASAVIALPWLANLAPGLPEPVIRALALEPSFVATRAAWVLIPWAGYGAAAVIALTDGRWTRMAARLQIAASAVLLGILVWWLLAGPIFATPAADVTTKAVLVAIAVLLVVDGVLTIRRARAHT